MTAESCHHTHTRNGRAARPPRSPQAGRRAPFLPARTLASTRGMNFLKKKSERYEKVTTSDASAFTIDDDDDNDRLTM